MDPKTWQQLIVVLCALMPGFVFLVVYGWLRGSTEADKPLASRVFTLIALTMLFDVVYVWVFGTKGREIWNRRSDLLEFVQIASLVLVLLAIVIPAFVALVWHYLAVAIDQKKMRVPLSELTRGAPFATSWDFAAKHGFGAKTYLRIQMKDGRYLGGYVGRIAHISLTPFKRDVFIANLRCLDEDGFFGADEISVAKYPLGGSGVWINCDDAVSVEFLNTEPRRIGVDKEETERLN